MAHETPTKEARHTADTAATETRRAADAVRKTADEARGGVARTMSDAADIAHTEADKRLRATAGTAADQAERSARAADDAASEYSDGSLPNEALSRVSGFLEDTARGLRETDLEQVTGEIRRFARRNPVAFMAGAAAVGFAASRLLRASERDDDWDDRSYGQGTAPGSWEGGSSRAGGVAGTAPGADPDAPSPAAPAVGGRQA